MLFCYPLDFVVLLLVLYLEVSYRIIKRSIFHGQGPHLSDVNAACFYLGSILLLAFPGHYLWYFFPVWLYRSLTPSRSKRHR